MSNNYDMDEQWSTQELNEALMNLISKGLIECGPNEEGEIVFWATELGKEHEDEGSE